MTGPKKPSLLRSLLGRLVSGLVSASNSTAAYLTSDGGAVFRICATRRGGMGVVYLCRLSEDPDSPPTLALKTFDDEYFFHPAMQQAVEAEATAWMRVSGAPFVLPLSGIITCDGKPHLLMPAVPPGPLGVTLADEIRRRPEGSDPARVFTVALSLALGMRECVRRVPGLVHGDIKPDNILLLGDGEPHLADFGTARLGALSGRGASVGGTAAYMAPECWDENGVVGEPADIYAFGATLFELLSGAPPFVVETGDLLELQAMHRTEPARFPGPAQEDALGELLRAMVLHCLAKEAGARPASADVLVDQLFAIGQEHAPIESLKVLASAAETRDHLDNPQLIQMRVEALLRHGDGANALEIFEASDVEPAGRLLRLYGTALSLAGRDEDAIAVFERCLETEEDAYERTECINEIGLSLKRRGRLEEARHLYEQAMGTTPEGRQLALRGNYAATLIELGETRRAGEILTALSRRYPDSPETWALLGSARWKLGDAAGAAAATGQAIRIAPRNGSYRVLLATIQLEGFRDVAAAMESLDTAYGLGHHVRQWIVLSIACHLLLRQADLAGELIDAIRRDVSDEEAESAFQEALAIVRRIVNIEPEDAGNGAAESAEEAAAPIAAPGPANAEDEAPHAPDRSEAEIRAAIRAGTQPHVQVRMSSVDGSTLFDFYYGPDRSDFAEQFASAVAHQRGRMVGQFGEGQERAAALAFAKCPECCTMMLSRRDEGERYACQGCGERVHVEHVTTAELEAVRQTAFAAAGITVRQADSGTLFVAVVAAGEDQAEFVARRFAEAGYTSVGLGRRTVHDMFAMTAHERGMDIPPEAQIFFRTIDSSEAAASEDGTPECLDRLLRALRREAGQIVSISATVPDTKTRDMYLMTPEEMYEGALPQISSDDVVGRRAMVEAAIRLGRLDDARQITAGLRLAFPENPDSIAAAGAVALAEGRHEAAIDLLEAVLRVRPRDHDARGRLFEACQGAGRYDRAIELWNELEAHGMLPKARNPGTSF
ncbi:tetratricopeptide repeat protein [Pseudomonas frederiksbergensis]|uniref:tetratricopeptide repeat protein n=1 Tax=Pseudomonas frederiksbergensis TaxID=104087 RepID=UPI0019812ADA|nr:tetratricopeptide repeat protein [Pseudomonas frederiksbergensis]MBN3862048.1 tetratricopeptide repeat protein [Pseudomonas frederiksbergensis]